MTLLKIVQESSPSKSTPLSERERLRLQEEANWERLWLTSADTLHPRRSAISRKQQELLFSTLPYRKGGRAVDLGCGWGETAHFLAEKGMRVDAVDLSRNALKKMAPSPLISTRQEFFPYTKLDEGEYNLVVASDLIAELPETLHRLALSEIARLLTPQGAAVLSTPIDIDSEDALVRFISLVETELDIEEAAFLYHAPAIRLPIFKQSEKFLGGMETIGRFIWQDRAISYVVVCGKRRPLSI